MTSAAAPARSIDETLAELVEEFDLLGDWEGRIEYVIDLGKDLPPLPEEARVEANKVPGFCRASSACTVDGSDSPLVSSSRMLRAAAIGPALSASENTSPDATTTSDPSPPGSHRETLAPTA